MKELEFWFDFGSNYSYLSMMRIELLARQQGVSITWKPFLLGAIFKSFGWETSPFVLQKAKGAYTWKDMARQCEKYGLRWKQPSQFPRRSLLPARVAILGASEQWVGAFCRGVMQLSFAEDQDVDNADAVGGVLTYLGLPAAEIIAAAKTDDVKNRLRAQTEEAMRRSIFGAPTFFAGTEMFWGNDRLEDALLQCQRDLEQRQ